MRFLEEVGEWRLDDVLYVDLLVLVGKLEQDLKLMVECFVEICKRCLKVNVDKSEMIVLDGEEGLECEISVDWARLEKVSYLKYLRFVLGESSA